MNDVAQLLQKQNEPFLVWYPELEYGYFPVDDYLATIGQSETGIYDKAYFDKYKEYVCDDSNPINDARKAFVDKFVPGLVGADVGIGCGTFVKSMGDHWYGFDVNPAGVEWLQQSQRYCNIYDTSRPPTIEVMTFWDSLEHIKDLQSLFEVLPKHVFVSLPIFSSDEDILASKHFRKDEHFHYFTEPSFLRLFENHGYDCLDINDEESVLGRESIMSFYFKKS